MFDAAALPGMELCIATCNSCRVLGSWRPLNIVVPVSSLSSSPSSSSSVESLWLWTWKPSLLPIVVATFVEIEMVMKYVIAFLLDYCFIGVYTNIQRVKHYNLPFINVVKGSALSISSGFCNLLACCNEWWMGNGFEISWCWWDSWLSPYSSILPERRSLLYRLSVEGEPVAWLKWFGGLCWDWKKRNSGG